MLWTGGPDLASGNKARPMGEVIFGYVWRTHTQFLTHIGFAWNGYKTCYTDSTGREYCGDWDMLTPRGYSDLNRMTPAIARVGYATAEIQRNFGIGRYQPHFNLGVGLYGWKIGSTRYTLKDPATQRKLSAISPGINASIGVEDYVHTRVALDAAVVGHYVFSGDPQNFPSGFYQNSHYVELRLSARWYFSISGAGAELPPPPTPEKKP
jgi:hypothetical protein